MSVDEGSRSSENKVQSVSTPIKDEAQANTEKRLYNDLYPERRGNNFTRSWFRTIIGLEGKEDLRKIKCERNVYSCLRNSPAIKLLLGALKSSGCEVDFRRHISCEVCDSNLNGGFDSQLNQVVVCHNVATSRLRVQGVLMHEMIHMFDYCQNKLDFNNLHHLACTEIRAANLAHCSFMSAWINGTASPLNFKKAHEACVKKHALASVVTVKNISDEEGMKAIDEVFPKCYADLEPIGRRPRRKSPDLEYAYYEAPIYGYDYKI